MNEFAIDPSHVLRITCSLCGLQTAGNTVANITLALVKDEEEEEEEEDASGSELRLRANSSNFGGCSFHDVICPCYLK
ncbi:hypothetical protein M0804_001635 [Polistes exclamans]|nr:hypothetical protein M0804_001635 [Polistes exclamans]